MGPPRTYSSVDDRRHPERHTRECATIPSGPRPRLPTRIKPRTRRRALESRNSHESHTRSAGQGEQCWQASLPAYTFLPQGSRTERTSSCDPFSKPQAGKPLSTPERSASRPGRPELELKPGRTTARWNSTHSQPRREPPEGGSCGAWWGAEDQTQESQIFFYLLGCVESFPSGEVKPAPQHFAGHTAEARPPSRPRRPPHAPRGWEEKRRARFDGEQARFNPARFNPRYGQRIVHRGIVGHGRIKCAVATGANDKSFRRPERSTQLDGFCPETREDGHKVSVRCL